MREDYRLMQPFSAQALAREWVFAELVVLVLAESGIKASIGPDADVIIDGRCYSVRWRPGGDRSEAERVKKLAGL